MKVNRSITNARLDAWSRQSGSVREWIGSDWQRKRDGAAGDETSDDQQLHDSRKATYFVVGIDSRSSLNWLVSFACANI